MRCPYCGRGVEPRKLERVAVGELLTTGDGDYLQRLPGHEVSIVLEEHECRWMPHEGHFESVASRPDLPDASRSRE